MKFKIEGDMELPNGYKEQTSSRNSIFTIVKDKKVYRLNFVLEVYDKDNDNTAILNGLEAMSKEGFVLNKVFDNSWIKPKKTTAKKVASKKTKK
jgi:hypothetical protein